MTASPAVLTAQATVEASLDENGNASVEMEVRRLAKPYQLSPPCRHYVVWIRPKHRGPRVLGRLEVNDDLEAGLRALTPFREFDIFVTAEDEAKPFFPSNRVIFRQHVML